jgi:hypothetical protein
MILLSESSEHDLKNFFADKIQSFYTMPDLNRWRENANSKPTVLWGKEKLRGK